MIRLLDLPGAPQLEARLELCPDLTAHSCNRTRQLLNSILDPLGFRLDWSGCLEVPEKAAGEELIDMTPYWDAEDANDEVTFWRRRGWDIAIKNGRPVRFFHMIRRAMILVEEGSGGLSKMKVEASIWKRERNDNAPVDQKAKRLDHAFLELGRRGRRGRAA